MSNTIDSVLAIRLLHLLITPFENSQAYQLGIIDQTGKPLKKVEHLSSIEQDAYSPLHRIVFKLQRLIARIPGGMSKLANILAAYWLIKENVDNTEEFPEEVLKEEFNQVLFQILYNDMIFVEETILLRNLLSEEGEGSPPANVTAGTAVTEPKIHKKDKNKYFKRNKTEAEKICH